MQRLTGSLVACLAALAGPARADVLYSTLGPGESYQQFSQWAEEGPAVPSGPVRQAEAFTAGGTDTVFDSARLAVSLRTGANEIDLRLYDTVGGQPGTVLETMHFSGQMPRFGDFGSGHLLTLQSALHPLLRAGETYWLLPLASGDTAAGWNWNDQGRNGPHAGSSQVEPMSWDVFQRLQAAFEVNGTPSPAPEPSGLALAGVGLAVLVGYVWRRRRGLAAA
jgi:hypothetical protein